MKEENNLAKRRKFLAGTLGWGALAAMILNSTPFRLLAKPFSPKKELKPPVTIHPLAIKREKKGL
ncbi:MAG: hypothetical protein NT007_11480 [Candidatus Kapabacteria bacterium]|nr:hypothetical protein [Candidatus Kapabacteria bacterium]